MKKACCMGVEMSAPLRGLIVDNSLEDAGLELAELWHGGYEPDDGRVDTPEAKNVALETGECGIVISDLVMSHMSIRGSANHLVKGGYR